MDSQKPESIGDNPTGVAVSGNGAAAPGATATKANVAGREASEARRLPATIRDFPIHQTDLALSRRIGITERVSLYARAEYFNLFNHPMFSYKGNFNNHLSNGGFGTASQTLNEVLDGEGGGLDPLYQIGGPRSAQLTLKVQF